MMSVRASSRALCFLLLLLPSWAAEADDPIATTLCEVAKAPSRFDGKIIRVRATVRIGLEASTLVATNCPQNSSVWFEVASSHPISSPATEYALLGSLADLQHVDRLNWVPIEGRPVVTFQADSNYKTLQKYRNQTYRMRDGAACMGCPLYSVTATFVGRFDHADHRFKAVRDKDTGRMTIGGGAFGHLGGWDSQIVVGSVSEVVATKIDPYTYEPKK
jgi:hypothetical protein